MTVLDCAIRLGALLRKTEEGSELIALKSSLEEKYNANDDFSEYERFAEKDTSRYYFYSWDNAYKTFLHVLDDEEFEHREIFLPTAKLISSDARINEYAQAAVTFGNIFENLVAVMISGGKYDTVIPSTWKYKIRNAISDVQVAVSRTLLPKTMGIFYQKNRNILNNAATQKYLNAREEKRLLPFAQEALKMMADASDVSEEEKLLYEKMYLIMEAVKNGVFYGFWQMINEISEEELIKCDGLDNTQLQEVSFVHKNNYSSFFGRGWLYRIQLKSKHVFFMAHYKSVNFGGNNDSSTVSGIVYPADDKGLFEK